MLLTAPLIPLFMILVGMGAADANRKNFNALARLSGHFMDRLKGLVEENTTSDNNTIHYENTDIIQLDTGEIVLYSEDEQDNIDSQEE